MNRGRIPFTRRIISCPSICPKPAWILCLVPRDAGSFLACCRSVNVMPVHKLLRIEWEGPLPVDTVLSRGGDDDYGLYQIYAHHLVFGAGALVYIGKAQEQTFAVRFAQHWE